MPQPPAPMVKGDVNSRWLWLRERLFPRGTNLIQITSYVILITLTILYVLESPEDANRFQYTSTLMVLAVMLVVQILLDDLAALFRSEEQGKWALLILSTLLTFYAIGVGRMAIAIYILFMIAAQVNGTFQPRPAIAFTLLSSGLYLLLLALIGATPEAISSTAVGLLIGMTFVVTLSQVLLRYSEQTERANRLLEQLQQANSELLEARQKEKELAIAEERVRVARDLHDGLGHHLTALSIQLQAAEKMINARPEMAAEALHNARGEVQAALKEVRQSVAALRETPVDMNDLPGTIGRLVADCGHIAQIRAVFVLEGNPAVLYPTTAMALFRTAQEGLTNVQKHADNATQVAVRLTYTEDEVRLSIADDGIGQPECPSNGAPSGGFGLAGLRERAALLGGRISCGPRPEGGFQLEMVLPVKPQEGVRL